MKTVFKILTALAAVAGAIYVAATYGDQVVAWAKRILASLPQCPCCNKNDDDIIEVEPTEAEEVPTEEEPAEEPVEEAAEESPAEEAPVVPANEPVAEETDFAE